MIDEAVLFTEGKALTMTMTPWNLFHGRFHGRFNGQNGNFEFDFVVRFQVDHFDYEKFGFWQ